MADIVEPLVNPALVLRKRYLLALSIIAVLLIGSQVLIQLTIVRNDDEGRVVNIAGRQRMLSQKMAKTALALILDGSPAGRAALAGELEAAASLWRRSHDGLLGGDPGLGLYGTNSAAVLALFRGIEPAYLEMLDAAAALSRRARDPAAAAAEMRALAGPILDREAAFLAGMDAITFRYADETRQRIDSIRLLEYLLLAVTCLTLTLEAMFIFRPAELQIGRYFREMRRAVSILREQATLDGMTGIYNKSTGLLILEREMQKSKRTGNPLSLCFVDLDGLKAVNDRHGHEEGDWLICRFARLVRDAIRAEDAAFRYGGDEFVLILTCDRERASAVVARIRKGTDALNVSGERQYRIDFSHGIAVHDPASGTSAEEFIISADGLMYAEKKEHHGRGVA